MSDRRGIVIASQPGNRNDSRRCFQFTWLGPRYDNESIFLNATCQDATRLARGIPCQLPLVASYDGTWPDVEYIWTHHASNASCILADNDVCAKYTYYFNGVAENATYMCTRAVDSNNTAITSGCYEETIGSYSTRVCLCRSIPGGVPCNSAITLPIFPMLILIFTAFVVTNYRSTVLQK
ncbi:uncharacterized protein LOC123670218 [Melitaea cinxia]|uniref:uncharacterized protein LOC123670218 n=1 Tax=Melitaea cinxia TaxID=113334 RepID=UPI001E273891|nr:uncharacterized protein LOC123670218 [Melitaea cinxia]